MFRGPAACLVLVALGGCAAFRPPEVSVQEVRAAGATGEALALEIVLELRNVNESPLELHEFRYSLAVDGRVVYAGRRAGAATVRPRSARPVTLPAVAPFRKTGWTPDGPPPRFDVAVEGRVVYNAPSQLAQLLFDAGVRRPQVGFAKRGVVVR